VTSTAPPRASGGSPSWTAGCAPTTRGRTLTRAAEGSQGNYFDEGSGDEYWIARIKKTGSHAHFAARVAVRIDPDARYEYRRVRSSAGVQVRR
jgi:hypothetical protein